MGTNFDASAPLANPIYVKIKVNNPIKKLITKIMLTNSNLNTPVNTFMKFIDSNPILLNTLSIPPNVPATVPKIKATTILVFQEKVIRIVKNLEPFFNPKSILIVGV